MNTCTVRKAHPVAVAIAVAVLCSSLPAAVRPFILDLNSSSSKCISEDLRADTISHGFYQVALQAPHIYMISVRVSDSSGRDIYQMENVDSEQFSFTASRTGAHTVCFWCPKLELPTLFPIDFEWKSGVAAEEWNDAAKKGVSNTHTHQSMLKGQDQGFGVLPLPLFNY